MRSLPLAALLLFAGCPDDDGPSADTAVPDVGLLVSEAGLALCSEPLAYCTPADPCGLNPRCSAQGLCLSSGRRDCDDGIPCTVDRCIPGGCEHSVTDSFCLIDDACHEEGEAVGCGRCAPDVSQTRWSPLDGLACDDNNACTKGDSCKQGMCVGQLYSCNDGLSCTTDSCDGAGGCNQVLHPTFCLIEKVCYPSGETDPTGCKICDVAVSQHDWQTRINVCKIDGHCYGPGAKDKTGCFSCDPLHAPDAWTQLPDLCLISQVCLKRGALHPSSCASCDPDASQTQWTPTGKAQINVSAFDADLDGFTASKPTKQVGWQRSTARFTSSPASLYYGDPATGSYDSGSTNSGTATTPWMELPAGQKAYLAFQLYMDTETAGNFDVLVIKAAGQVLWSKSTDMKAADYKTWTSVNLDLSAFDGQAVQVEFQFDTKDGTNNQSEGVYIDDVTLLTGCGAK
jgi:hypothetical protein